MKLLRILLSEDYQGDLENEIWKAYRKRLSAEEQIEFLKKHNLSTLTDVLDLDVESLEELLDDLPA